ncbi:MAG TPA: aminodeoxychorismate synthase component I, partial [Tepidisphaeraceae bacterium]|nr:aminodeoxychorismate synthase component I [Tepidisphaeraceae bacterium]
DSGGEGQWNRWSYRAGPPSLMLLGKADNALGALQSIQSTLKAEHHDGPPFKGGWLGYLSYDLGRCFEKLPTEACNDLGWPLFALTWHERVIAHDGTSGRNYLCSATPPTGIKSDQNFTRTSEKTASERIDFQGAVRKVLDYIAAGDVFQVNLAQRFELPMRRKPADVYRELRRRYPAGFGAFLNYDNHALISNSPELFLKVDSDRKLITRPIKGTRPRRKGMELQLRDSAKDQAELNMIVDLERNDLGRVCEIGSVRVTNPREIETHPTVYHGVATIEGRLRKEVGLVELLRATFPGGSVTGAPKIRAMEIIEELEPVRRGPYCGAIGYLSADGQMQFNIAIRTIVVNQARAYVSVGGGIVADSDPADEYEETMVKAQAIFDVLK